MLTICAAQINGFLYDNKFERGLAILPPSFSARVAEIKNAQGRQERLCGMLLLYHMLKDNTVFDPKGLNEAMIATRSGGKPYICGAPYVDFSITHKGGVVVCALSISDEGQEAFPIGVDAETIPASCRFKDIADRYFTAGEIERINGADNPAEEFARLWTRKESLLKMRGEGIDRLRGADTERAGEDIAFSEYTHECDSQRYIITLCHNKKEMPPSRIETDAGGCRFL